MHGCHAAVSDFAQDWASNSPLLGTGSRYSQISWVMYHYSKVPDNFKKDLYGTLSKSAAIGLLNSATVKAGDFFFKTKKLNKTLEKLENLSRYSKLEDSNEPGFLIRRYTMFKENPCPTSVEDIQERIYPMFLRVFPTWKGAL